MTGDIPPICSQMYFQVHPFSRLISRSFSVRSARVMADSFVEFYTAKQAISTPISARLVKCAFACDSVRVTVDVR
jgi:hypothetical protein